MDLDDIITYLKESNALPTMSYATDKEMNGNNGDYNGWTNKIRINDWLNSKDADPRQVKATPLHEYTHALHRQIGRETAMEPWSPMQEQFTDGHAKLWANPFPSRTPEEKQYRNNSGESFAYGVANTMYPHPNMYRSTNSHQDTTRATEMNVLLELATRARTERNIPRPTFMQNLSNLFR